MCDESGCVAKANGIVLAVAQRLAGLRDDCERAGILILAFPRPRFCTTGVVIDSGDLRRKGTHAIFIADGQAKVVAVADVRGDRPWSSQAALPVGYRSWDQPPLAPRRRAWRRGESRGPPDANDEP
jgi:competence protein ComEC